MWNNKQELVMVLVLPILFFSIFAMIFSRGVSSGDSAINVAIVDDDMTATSQRIARLLKLQSALQIELGLLNTTKRWSIERLTRVVMRDHDVDMVVYLPDGIEANLQSQSKSTVKLFSEGSNPIGDQIIRVLLAQVISEASRNRPPSSSLDNASSANEAPSTNLSGSAETSAADAGVSDSLVDVETTHLFAVGKHNPKIAMYAAGIAVMFLLFSATGAGGSLLEEHEAGTLDRLLSSQLRISELLAGKWLYIMALGCVQLTVMFLWAQQVFSVDLIGHLSGFALMTFCTASATASLGICLAVFCRSRTQLTAVSTVLILTMSALGGSMVPRYVMSQEMQRWGHLTFNAWALDGFQKVFWYDMPVTSLQLEVTVLLGMTIILGCIARLYADRWDAR
ncbi:ABC-2 type transporter [Rhodopirellula maiorica SM1]|uniref:ABC-2 type transporter n=1 Tax=Rhodopirellula maiorica SM1 TaxID=1265738 RepID=M5S114_9BACT|nr:ABC-2 type transporter [Rhodopirellula maiorica SM1]